MTTYKINGRQVVCEVENKSKICEAAQKVVSNASYNDSRLSKLQDEFFCKMTNTRSMTDKELEKYNANSYKCGTSLAKQIGNELDTAAKAVSDLYSLTRGDVINTYDIYHSASQTKAQLNILDRTIAQDKWLADSIFEDALYDTNASGIAALFSIFIPPLGLMAFAANSMQNNHVDGKIDRAIDDINDVLAGVLEITSLGY